MKERSLLGLSPAGFHRIAYTEWGDAQAHPRRAVICVHGLTRNGRDFDALADVLSGRVRVACPDVVGRGRSDWLPNPDLYGTQQYCADMTALIARLDVEQVDWVGTSMGGLIGMILATYPRSPIRRLVLNDVGPFVPRAGLERIAGFIGTDPSFGDLAALEGFLRQSCGTWGPLTDTQWRHLATHSARRKDDGTLGLAYDPGIAKPMRTRPIEDVTLWSLWDAVRCPVLVLRGVESDMLLLPTAMEMTRRGPKATLVEIPGCGHAPALMAEDQIAVVRDWLTA